jgi:hypothetical protein
MALVSTPIVHFFNFLDAGNKTFKIRFKTTGDNFTASYNLLQSGAAALAEMTNLTLVSQGLTYIEVESDEVSGAGEGEKKAEISAKLVTEDPAYAPGQTRYGQIYIPGPVDGLFAGAAGTDLYDVIDPNDAAVQALLALFEAGLGILPSYTLSDYQTILDPTVAGNVKGKRITRRSRSG